MAASPLNYNGRQRYPVETLHQNSPGLNMGQVLIAAASVAFRQAGEAGMPKSMQHGSLTCQAMSSSMTAPCTSVRRKGRP
jgi:hypothetical protein